MRIRKKCLMAWAVLLMGFVLAIEPTTQPALGAFAALAGMCLGVFSAADVADKKLNGGRYG